MHTQITLNKKIGENLWDGSLAVIDKEVVSIKGEVLLKQESENSVKLHLDSSVKVSKIAERTVLSYTNAKAEILQSVKPGVTFTTKNSVWPSLKK